jgi:hypothetical protein
MSQQVLTALYTASTWVIPLVIAITFMKRGMDMSRGYAATTPRGVSVASALIH